MKIIRIETFHMRHEDPGISLFDGSYDDCVIRLTTDTGHVGIGEVESFPAAIQALIHAPDAHNHARGLAGILLGRDPSDPTLWDELYNACDYIGRRGLTMHALGGLDIALWDLRGQAAGKPIHALLGGAKRDRLRAYGTIYPIGKTVDSVKAQVAGKLAKMPLRAAKLVADPWWMDDIEHTKSLLLAAREVLGPDRGVIVDCALAYQTAAEGLKLYPAYKAVGLLFLEAPLPLDDMPGHAEMAKHGIPLGVGDLGLTHVLEFIEAMDHGGASICQPDITMVGGFTGIQKIAAAARERGKRVITHGYKTNIEIAANLHFLAAHDADELLEYSTSESPLRWEMTNETLPVSAEGYVSVPQTPGLGVTLSEEAVSKFCHSRQVSAL